MAWSFVSGQLALIDGRGEGDITVQTERAFDAVLAILREADMTLDNVAKATVWLTDPADFAPFNAVSLRAFPRHFLPVRASFLSSCYRVRT